MRIESRGKDILDPGASLSSEKNICYMSRTDDGKRFYVRLIHLKKVIDTFMIGCSIVAEIIKRCCLVLSLYNYKGWLMVSCTRINDVF